MSKDYDNLRHALHVVQTIEEFKVVTRTDDDNHSSWYLEMPSIRIPLLHVTDGYHGQKKAQEIADSLTYAVKSCLMPQLDDAKTRLKAV